MRTRHDGRQSYCRAAKRQVQARGWVAEVGSVNLGLYQTSREAFAAVVRWYEAGGSPTDGLPPGVLPKWVREVAPGKFVGYRRSRAGVVLKTAAVSDPAVAFHLIFRRIRAARRAPT